MPTGYFWGSPSLKPSCRVTSRAADLRWGPVVPKVTTTTCQSGLLLPYGDGVALTLLMPQALRFGPHHQPVSPAGPEIAWFTPALAMLACSGIICR